MAEFKKLQDEIERLMAQIKVDEDSQDARTVLMTMWNDGFCDKCNVFKGHEGVFTATTPIGVFIICAECREEIELLSRKEQKEVFKKMRGVE